MFSRSIASARSNRLAACAASASLAFIFPICWDNRSARGLLTQTGRFRHRRHPYAAPDNLERDKVSNSTDANQRSSILRSTLLSFDQLLVPA